MSFTETHLSQLLELRERACITNNKGFKQANIGKRHHCMSGGHVDLQKTAEHKCARAHTHTARQPHKDTLTDRIWLQRHLGLLRPPSFFPDFSGLPLSYVLLAKPSRILRFCCARAVSTRPDLRACDFSPQDGRAQRFAIHHNFKGVASLKKGKLAHFPPPANMMIDGLLCNGYCSR
jgi:hypothetical protein